MKRFRFGLGTAFASLGDPSSWHSDIYEYEYVALELDTASSEPIELNNSGLIIFRSVTSVM